MISSTTRIAGPYVGNGVQTIFPFSFKVFQNSDVLVLQTDTLGNITTLTLSSAYSVTLNGNQDTTPGGSITMVSAPASGYTITLSSQVAALQGLNLANVGNFYPTSVDNALDLLTILIQQQALQLGNALTLPITALGVSTVLPAPIANSYVGWNSAANALINYTGMASAAVSAAMTPVVGASTTAAAVAALGIPSMFSGRNVIVNGDYSISQVNGGSLITPLTFTFPMDMVQFNATQASKLQTQQSSTFLGALGATACLTTSVLSSYTPISTDYFFNDMAIEGFNFARFQYGTASAKAGSLQFKVRASVAGTYSGAIRNTAATRSYPFTYTVAANTDTQIQIPNIPGDTGGAWVGATNAAAAMIIFDLGTGSANKGAAGSWQAGGIFGVTGATNLVSQVNGSTLTITDVQFEVGSMCTQFERKLWGTNLRECQRYLQLLSGNSSLFCASQAYSTTSGVGVFWWLETMRSAPTITSLTNPLLVLLPAGGSSGATVTFTPLSTNSMQLSYSGGSGLTAGNTANINWAATGSLLSISAQI